MYTSQSFFYSMVNGISWDFIVLWREWYERHRIFYFMAGNANLFLVRFSIDINLHIVETFSHLTVMQHVQIFYLCDEWNERTHYTISYPMITDTMERKFSFYEMGENEKKVFVRIAELICIAVSDLVAFLAIFTIVSCRKSIYPLSDLRSFELH